MIPASFEHRTVRELFLVVYNIGKFYEKLIF